MLSQQSQDCLCRRSVSCQFDMDTCWGCDRLVTSFMAAVCALRRCCRHLALHQHQHACIFNTIPAAMHQSDEPLSTKARCFVLATVCSTLQALYQGKMHLKAACAKI